MKLLKIAWFFWIIFHTSTGNYLGGVKMEITSSAFKDQEKIPTQYIMPEQGQIFRFLSHGKTFLPNKVFALSVVDPHPVAQNWVIGLSLTCHPIYLLLKREHRERKCHRDPWS